MTQKIGEVLGSSAALGTAALGADTTDLGLPPGVQGTAGLGTPVQPLPGVATVWDTKSTISSELDRLVQAEFDKVEPGAVAASLNVHTRRGVNLVIGARSESGRMSAVLWVGKSGWNEPIREGWESGVSLRAAWGGK